MLWVGGTLGHAPGNLMALAEVPKIRMINSLYISTQRKRVSLAWLKLANCAMKPNSWRVIYNWERFVNSSFRIFITDRMYETVMHLNVRSNVYGKKTITSFCAYLVNFNYENLKQLIENSNKHILNLKYIFDGPINLLAIMLKSFLLWVETFCIFIQILKFFLSIFNGISDNFQYQHLSVLIQTTQRGSRPL